MNTYIDFDGVIMDTETHLFNEFESYKNINSEADGFDYVANMNWENYLKNSKFIPGSLEFLDENPDAIILTKVCSVNEARAKINILREYNVFNNVIIVPYGIKKSDIVYTIDNILIDDTVQNLDDFTSAGGLGIYFNKDNSIVDPWHNINQKYIMIDSLKYLKNNIRKRNK